MSDKDHTGLGGLDQNEYDALAELFLGDSTFAPPPTSRGVSERRSAADALDDNADDPDDVDGVPDETPLETPAGASIAPSQSVPRTRAPSMGPAPIELAILGHLPVRAGLWLKEYACSLAQECGGSVALLRLAPDIASVDLIGADGFEPHGQAPTFGDAVRRARIDASRFLLRVNETAEPALAESDSVDRVTILTGADEAALVASYRLVKSLAAAWDRRFDLDEGPELRLAIMGSSVAKSRGAAQKLRSASESFLQRRIEILTCSAMIGSSASPSTMLYRGEANEGVMDLIELLHPPRKTPTAPRATASPALDKEDDSGLRLVGAEEENLLLTPAGETTVDEEPVPEIVIRRARVAGGDTPTARTDRAEPRSTLASRVGLEALETVCPHTPRVEFAVAADGSLHLVTESRGALDQATGIECLVAAAAWARANFSLLLRAEPRLTIPSANRADDHGPTLHVLVDDARVARPLLDSEVRVHLSRRVETENQSLWITDELN